MVAAILLLLATAAGLTAGAVLIRQEIDDQIRDARKEKLVNEITRHHLKASGVPDEVLDQALLAGVSWLQLAMLLMKYGPQVVAVLQRDLAAGKSILEIVRDLLGLVTPAAAPVKA